MKNVNSELSMRMDSNDNLNYYKIIKEIGIPNCNLFNDGFEKINIPKWDLG